MGAYDELDKFQTEEGRKIVSAFVAKALADEQQPADVVTAEQQQCGSHVHPDFVGDQKIRCELPDGHFWHRNGERAWTS